MKFASNTERMKSFLKDHVFVAAALMEYYSAKGKISLSELLNWGIIIDKTEEVQDALTKACIRH